MIMQFADDRSLYYLYLYAHSYAHESYSFTGEFELSQFILWQNSITGLASAPIRIVRFGE